MEVRKAVDCRSMPNDVGCSLRISGREDEVLDAAVDHAVKIHGHKDTPELREDLRNGLEDEVPATSVK